MDMMQKYPRISDMIEPAQRRLPKFVHAYLAAGTGTGQAMCKNEQAFSEIDLTPRFLRGTCCPGYQLRAIWPTLCGAFWYRPCRPAISYLAKG